MRSEWEYLSVLQGVSDVLMGPEDQIRTRLSSLMGVVTENTSPLRVSIFAWDSSAQFTFRAIYEYFAKLENCHVDLVAFGEAGRDGGLAFRKDDWDVIQSSEYDLSDISPDIVFYPEPSGKRVELLPKFRISEVSKHVEYTVCIPSPFEVFFGGEPLDSLSSSERFHAWRLVAHNSRHAEELRRCSYCDGVNVVELDGSVFDALQTTLEKKGFCVTGSNSLVDGQPFDTRMYCNLFKKEIGSYESANGERIGAFAVDAVNEDCKNKAAILFRLGKRGE
ncbi:hypothetical protein [Eggerthella timonensis]|uniref:hypothetical protein n=1 Tax=Eggerthella timonensis TaxID=1871008 RepID=UPI0011AF5FAE|nr:hypothetical protein [Eggerthella timonensis]